MTWHTGRLCGVDLETTGVDLESDRIVTACVVQCGGGQPTESATWLADPGIEISEAAAAVHGITTDRARTDGRLAADVVAEVVEAVTAAARGGLPVIVMNAVFDLTLLDREARRHGVQPLADAVGGELTVVDPRVLDKHLDQFRRGSRKLEDLARHYRVEHGGAHRADADALAACRIVWRMGQTFPDLSRVPLDQLHQLQMQWAREQAEALAGYFRRTPGKEHQADSVRSDWPLIPHQRNTTA
ncbi:exonuclease domain-containing protein [Streptomyces pinistramenti]|uniref:exonuclease domain-containing protein n=1 Tax=Streptomyces pinistramenti TaxID=2884812 RepID=UPI001D07723C|nr:exonuclease domain-containing protein [Streptomyces pinistramenti]MCB5910349.1 3'-5' exonuclease [Streptomyces pinistramenti]